MATKTQNFYGATVDTVELGGYNDRGTITFKDDKGETVKRSTRKGKFGLIQELVDSFNGKYPIDVIVDGRGSIAWINKHDFNFDLSNVRAAPTYSVWCFSKAGGQILHTSGLILHSARVLAKNLNDGTVDAKHLNALGEIVFKVVKSTESFEVID
jgi:hypothetical protein